MAILPSDKIVRGGDLITIGSAIKTELAKKQDTLVSGTNIKTINNNTLLGEGDVTIRDGIDGKSAYQIWLDAGNIGDESVFLASLQGNSGYTGAAGELEVVNNLTDGGATSALSAQQGVVLNQKLVGVGETSIAPSSIVSAGGRIDGNTYTNVNGSQYYGGLVDVTSYRGRRMEIVAGGTSTGGGSIAFVKNEFTNGANVDWATGWSSVYLFSSSGQTWIGDVPEDAVYLYVYLQSTTTSYRPQSISIYEEGGVLREIETLREKTLLVDGLVEDVNGVDGAEINVNNIASCGGHIDSGQWTSEGLAQQYYAGLIDVSDYQGMKMKIISGGTSSSGGSIAFVKNTFTDGEPVQWADGWTAPYAFPSMAEEWFGNIPDDAVYLYVYLHSPGISFRPQSITVLASSGIVTDINLIQQELKNLVVTVADTIDTDSLVSCGGSISSGVWKNYSDYYASLINVTNSRRGKMRIVASDMGGSYTFLKSGISVNNQADFATGYSSVIVMSAGGIYDITVPDDAVYLYVYLQSPGIDYTPKTVAYIRDLDTAFASIKKESASRKEDSIRLFSYNIGHFSNGVQKNSTITSEQYQSKVDQFRALLSKGAPDVFGLLEYSAVFGKNASDVNVNTKDELFNFQKTEFESEQKNYACYALFGGYRAPLYNVQINDFDCLENETITHTTAVRAQDYRYISADLYAFGVSIKLVVTHLAFDNNRSGVLQDAQISELIEKYADNEYVVMMGDWNVHSFSEFDAFVSAGYTLANDGSLITYPAGGTALDNIVVKGLNVNNASIVNSDLSDHLPLLCEVYL